MSGCNICGHGWEQGGHGTSVIVCDKDGNEFVMVMTVGIVVTADETDFKDLNLKLNRNKEHDL